MTPTARRAEARMLIVLCGSIAALSSCASVPDGVTAWVESPPSVELGEHFKISAHVDNASGKAVKLRTLDIGDAYLDGIAIHQTDPPHSEKVHLPIDNTLSFVFEIDIPPGERVVVDFHAEAQKSGVYQGDFDLCVNSAVNCFFQTITTPVRLPWSQPSR